MEASAGLVAGSHNRNELVVIRRDGEPGVSLISLSLSLSHARVLGFVFGSPSLFLGRSGQVRSARPVGV